MFTDIASVRDELDTRLKSALPNEWRVEASLSEAIKSLVPVVYIEFTTISSAINGVPMSLYQVAAAGDLIVASAETDTVKAESSVDEHALRIAQAIQVMPDLYWDSAKKERLTGGQIAWRFSFTAITDLPSTDG